MQCTVYMHVHSLQVPNFSFIWATGKKKISSGNIIPFDGKKVTIVHESNTFIIHTYYYSGVVMGRGGRLPLFCIEF